MYRDIDFTVAHTTMWMGDLNYRIEDLRRERVIELSESDAWDVLAPNDQLLRQRKQSGLFYSFSEAPLRFPPTFKYEEGAAMSLTKPTRRRHESAKMRVPSWCDRVLISSLPGVGLTHGRYDCVDSLNPSDHSPVFHEAVLRLPPVLAIPCEPFRRCHIVILGCEWTEIGRVTLSTAEMKEVAAMSAEIEGDDEAADELAPGLEEALDSAKVQGFGGADADWDDYTVAKRKRKSNKTALAQAEKRLNKYRAKLETRARENLASEVVLVSLRLPCLDNLDIAAKGLRKASTLRHQIFLRKKRDYVNDKVRHLPPMVTQQSYLRGQHMLLKLIDGRREWGCAAFPLAGTRNAPPLMRTPAVNSSRHLCC